VGVLRSPIPPSQVSLPARSQVAPPLHGANSFLSLCNAPRGVPVLSARWRDVSLYVRNAFHCLSNSRIVHCVSWTGRSLGVSGVTNCHVLYGIICGCSRIDFDGDFPWQPSTKYHDDHHKYFHVNFGQASDTCITTC
jgi:hypothetical protein